MKYLLLMLLCSSCITVTVVQRTGDANCKDSETDARMIQNL